MSNSFVTPWTVALTAPSLHRILQVKILKWFAISFSRGSSPPRDLTCISCVCRWFLYHWATREARTFITLLLPYIFPSCFYICQYILPTSAEIDVCDQSFLVTVMRNEPEERKDGEEADFAFTLGKECVWMDSSTYCASFKPSWIWRKVAEEYFYWGNGGWIAS